MAHYDCSNCGESYGIGYGFCKVCNPDSVLKLEKEWITARQKADNYFQKEINKLKDQYVDEQTKDIKAMYDEEYNKHKPKPR